MSFLLYRLLAVISLRIPWEAHIQGALEQAKALFRDDQVDETDGGNQSASSDRSASAENSSNFFEKEADNSWFKDTPCYHKACCSGRRKHTANFQARDVNLQVRYKQVYNQARRNQHNEFFREDMLL